MTSQNSLMPGKSLNISARTIMSFVFGPSLSLSFRNWCGRMMSHSQMHLCCQHTMFPNLHASTLQWCLQETEVTRSLLVIPVTNANCSLIAFQDIFVTC